MLFSVCMCTYKRDHLSETLLSISKLKLPENAQLEVIVVDNDENLYGKSLVERLVSVGYPYKINYVSEPMKNISAARNMCLDTANGEWIAFLDDDEVADIHWLDNLYKTALDYDAAAVFGRVISTFPENTPEWIIKGGFFDRKERTTGTTVSSGACNSTLVKNDAIADQRFDLAYGLSGGEDADFFHRLYKKGHKLVYCQEAFVSEEIERNRLNINFLIKRKIRIGGSFTLYRYQNKTLYKKVTYGIKSISFLFIELSMTTLTLPLAKKVHYKWLLKSADRYGKIKYLFKNNLQALY